MLNPRMMSGGNRPGRGRGILGQYYPPSASQAQGGYGGYYNGGHGGYGDAGYVGQAERHQEAQLLQLLKRQSDVIEKLSEQVGLDNLPVPQYPGNYGGYGSYSNYSNYGYPPDYPYGDYSGNYGTGYTRGRGRMTQRMNNQQRQASANQQGRQKKGKSGYPVKTTINVEPGQYEDNYTYYCHACKYQCSNNSERKNHNKSTKHLRRMEEVNRMPKHQSQPILDKIAEVKTLREREKKLMKCYICDMDLSIPYSDHKNQNQHKNRLRMVKAGCSCCKTGAMKNFTELKEHRLLDEHKTNAEAARKKLEEEWDKCTDESSFPPYEDGTPIGQLYVEKVEGYFCKLCKKFFPTEQEAYIDHCAVRNHYNKVKAHKFSKPEENSDNTQEQEADKADSASAKSNFAQEKNED